MANHCGSIEDFQGKYYIKGKKDLQRDVIRITYLGEFEVSNEYETPLEQKVKNRLQKLCPSLNIKEIEVHIYPTLKKIDVLGNGLYTGRVTLTYTLAGNH